MRLLEMLKSRLLTGAILLSCLGLFFVAHTVSTARGTPSAMPGSAINLSTESASSSGGVVAEGRVVTYPGERVSVAAELGGRIARLAVAEGQVVHKGDLIAQLEAEEYRAGLAEATARLGEIDADISLLEWKLKRTTDLTARGATPLVEVEQQRRDLAAARARRLAAAAHADQLRIQVDRTTITAPIDGTVITRFAQESEVVQAGSPIVTIANLAHTRIEAEVNEFDGAAVVPGGRAFVTAEGFPGVRWPATVEEVPQVVVTRQLRPQDPGRPTDSGVVLVKLALPEPTPLRLGQRVEVRIPSDANSAGQ
ncbi:MAG TPA: efflux RND transporter periplasmic adaptor subunit [Tepidisphaeraceae bacterium]